jgi:glycosyltransferase involved in cell wall biosynthesis
MAPRRHTVVLGPTLDLHTGIHGALVERPPRGYRYVVRGARHVFPHAREHRHFSPLTHRHWGELVDFGPGRGLVHSSRWPVLARRHWVVELDDVGYPAYAGRHALAPGFQRQFRARWTTAFARDVVRRVELMLGAYTHPSCGAVIFRTRAAIARACQGLVEMGLEPWIPRLAPRCAVVYPATAALPRRQLVQKWDAAPPLRLLFCGRDFAGKDGALALRVVRRLMHGGAAVDFTYIGEIPPASRQTFADVLARAQVFASLSRGAVQRLMARSHILFHPSPRESVGMVFIEAAAAGLAVVASRSTGLAHLAELLPPRGVFAVDREHGSAGEHEERFTRALIRLLGQSQRARRMGLANHRQALEGPISLHRRNGVLAALYGETRRYTGPPLTLDALWRGHPGTAASLDSRRVGQLIERYRRRRRLRALSVYI